MPLRHHDGHLARQEGENVRTPIALIIGLYVAKCVISGERIGQYRGRRALNTASPVFYIIVAYDAFIVYPESPRPALPPLWTQGKRPAFMIIAK